MHTRLFQDNAFHRIRILALLANAITIAILVTLALSPAAGGASLTSGTGGSGSDSQTEPREFDIGGNHHSDLDRAEPSDPGAALLPENVINGYSDVLYAEFGLWWLDDKPEQSIPGAPFPVGPYQ